MKLFVAVSLLRLLKADARYALTSAQILDKWNDRYGTAISLRTLQRYLAELSSDAPEGGALIEVDQTQRDYRYYLRLKEVAHWFMTEEVAFYQYISQQVLTNVFGEMPAGDYRRQLDVAEDLLSRTSAFRRLRDRTRIVPDGIGRLRADIDATILSAVMQGIANNRQIQMTYDHASGGRFEGVVNPLGLVAKDGTLYLLSNSGMDAQIRAYPLQRMRDACVLQSTSIETRDFDLDRHIRSTHQLSHVFGEALLDLKLRVNPRWLYHFEERPLSEGQRITQPEETGEWAIVEVRVPDSLLLLPFLASMGPGVEVIAPVEMRQKIAAWLAQAAAQYDAGKVERRSQRRAPATSN